MLKDPKLMIYECDKCGLTGTAKDRTIFSFEDYSSLRSKKLTGHNLCRPCYVEYYRLRDGFIDSFLEKKCDGS